MPTAPLAILVQSFLSSPMANSNAAVFSVEQRLFVKTKDKQVQVVIFPKWTKEVEGTLFTNIDFYRCRGIRKILTSLVDRSDQSTQRNVLHIAAKRVCDHIRRARDRKYREQVLSQAGGGFEFKGVAQPRSKVLRAIAVQMPDVLEVTMYEEEGVHEGCAITVLSAPERNNRHSTLWIVLNPSTCEYMAKAVAHQYANLAAGSVAGPLVDQDAEEEQGDLDQEGEQAEKESRDTEEDEDDSDATLTFGKEEEPSEIESQKEQSENDSHNAEKDQACFDHGGEQVEKEETCLVVVSSDDDADEQAKPAEKGGLMKAKEPKLKQMKLRDFTH